MVVLEQIVSQLAILGLGTGICYLLFKLLIWMDKGTW